MSSEVVLQDIRARITAIENNEFESTSERLWHYATIVAMFNILDAKLSAGDVLPETWENARNTNGVLRNKSVWERDTE